MRAKSIPKEKRFQLVLECRKSGLTDRQWCEQNGINPGTFYNWVKRFRQEGTFEIPESEHRNTNTPVPHFQDVVQVSILPDFTKEPELPASINQSDSRNLYPIEIQCASCRIRLNNAADPHLAAILVQNLGGL